MPLTSKPLVLTIDIGSSSTRAILFDASAQVVTDHLAHRPHKAQTAADGTVVYDADEILDGVVGVIDQILHSAGPSAGQIAAVAMDTFVGNILGVDGNDAAVTPVFTYADTRNAPDAQALRTELGATGAAAVHDRTGCLIHTSYLPARFRWLARTEAQWLKASKRWVSVGEYVLHKFLGKWLASYSVASWSGLLNRRKLEWDSEWLAQLPVQAEQLSPLGDIDEPLRGLRPEWSQRWPALQSVDWLPAVGDGAAANIGSGCDTPERVALTIGTTGAMRVVVDPNLGTVPDGLWLYRVDAKRGLLGGATTEGGNLFAWLRDTLQLPPVDDLEHLLLNLPPAAHGLTVLPFVAGERAPGWREDARAVLAGINLHTSPIDLVQASLEAIAYRFGLIYRRVSPHLGAGATHKIIASGGAILSSPAWLQIMADVLGESLLTLAEKEATSRGLALLALEQMGVIQSPGALPPATGDTYAPDKARHALHMDALARQVALYEKVLTS